MLKVSSSSVPPQDIASCIGIICNGEIEITSDLKERVQKCRSIIGVDGGLNHCKKMSVIPHWIVGDFDSVEPAVLEEFKMSTDAITLPRAKDCTDLEAAIEKAKEISASAKAIIWGGLGGRIDHTLGNLFLLFRNPAHLFLETEQQVLFAVSEVIGKVKISHDTYKTLALFPLNGPASNVSIKDREGLTNIPFVDKSRPFIFPFSEKCTLKVEVGELLVILDQRNIAPMDAIPKSDIFWDFSLKQSLIHSLSYLAHQSICLGAIKLFSDKESIFNIRNSSERIPFISKRGQTISLIPFYGPAIGIETKGLKWELGKDTLDKLDKNFIGISNVSLGDNYSVAVDQGELLCIVNEELIDNELVEAKIDREGK